MMNRILGYILLSFVIAAGLTSAATAEIYTYEDERGVIHFTDNPPTSRYTPYVPSWWEKKQTITQIIKNCAQKFDLEEALIKAVIKVESDFDARALSSKGAAGLMQLIEETAQDMKVSNRYDPSDNINGGSKYLRKMLDMFNEDLDLALAAYNAGPTTVKNYKRIPPYPETQRYVKKVKRYLDHYRNNQS